MHQPSPAEVDSLLADLQAADGVVRQRAEAQLSRWSETSLVVVLLLPRLQLAPTVGSRQLAATLLSWRLPPLWAGLSPADREGIKNSLLECFGACTELPVLRALSEVCNSVAQAIAGREDSVWEGLLHCVSAALAGGSAVHRRVALELLASLVDSLGARIHLLYPSLGQTLIGLLRDSEAIVRVTALNTVGTLASSWCATATDRQSWYPVVSATLDTAAEALRAAGKSNCSVTASPEALLSSALRALRQLVMLLEVAGAGNAVLELTVCCVVAHVEDNCRAQALQTIRVIARRQPQLLTGEALGLVVAAVYDAVKPRVVVVSDDGEEDGPAVHAAKDCIRSLSREVEGAANQIFLLAGPAMQSTNPSDRAAALQAASAALTGPRNAPTDWAVPFACGIRDSIPYVRISACQAAALLSGSLREGPETDRGLQILLEALALQLPKENNAEVAQLCADAMSAIFVELASDDAGRALQIAVPPVLVAIRATAEADHYVKFAGTLGKAAAAAADGFAPFATEALVALLPQLRTNNFSSEVFCAGLAACGPVLAAAWSETTLLPAREEAASTALRVLSQAEPGCDARMHAHGFFSRIALAIFEEFAQLLGSVVPPAVAALQLDPQLDAGLAARKRIVWTGTMGERIAATEALGRYAVACGKQFATHLHSTLPALLAQMGHPHPEVRAATAYTLGQVSGVLSDIASAPELNAADRAEVAGMAQRLAEALFAALESPGSSSVLRAAILSSQDAVARQGFLQLAGQQGVALGTRCKDMDGDDVESSDGGEDSDDGEEEGVAL